MNSKQEIVRKSWSCIKRFILISVLLLQRTEMLNRLRQVDLSRAVPDVQKIDVPKLPVACIKPTLC